MSCTRSLMMAVLAGVLCVPTILFAGNHKGNTKVTKPEVTVPTVWLVFAVDASANTLTIQTSDGKENRTNKLTTLTTITVNGQPAKITDLTPGLKVDCVLGGDGQSLSSVSAADYKPPQAEEPRRRNKKRK